MRIVSFIYDMLYFVLFGGVKFARRKGVKIGDGCRIYIKNWGTEPFLITIGNKVTITSGVKIITHDGSTCLVSDDEGYRYQKYLPVNIGDRVFVGVNSIIMPGVNIGDDVVIGAGSVVVNNLPSGGVYAGTPAKKLTDFEIYSNKIKSTCVSNQDIDGKHCSYKERVFAAIELQNEKNKHCE